MFWSLSRGNTDAGGFTVVPRRYWLPPECWQLVGVGQHRSVLDRSWVARALSVLSPEQATKLGLLPGYRSTGPSWERGRVTGT